MRNYLRTLWLYYAISCLAGYTLLFHAMITRDFLNELSSFGNEKNMIGHRATLLSLLFVCSTCDATYVCDMLQILLPESI